MSIVPRDEDLIVSANELFRLTNFLLEKDVASWSDEDVGLLVKTMENVSPVDFDTRNSSLDAIAGVRRLFKLFPALYRLRPDVAATLVPALNSHRTPDSVIVVLNVDVVVPHPEYMTILGEYPPGGVRSGEAAAALPAAINTGNLPMIWSFPDRDAAIHFTGYIQGQIPGLKVTIINTMTPPERF